MQTVTSDSEAFRKRIESVLEMAIGTTTSLAHTYAPASSMLEGDLYDDVIAEDAEMADGSDPTIVEVVG